MLRRGPGVPKEGPGGARLPVISGRVCLREEDGADRRGPQGRETEGSGHQVWAEARRYVQLGWRVDGPAWLCWPGPSGGGGGGWSCWAASTRWAGAGSELRGELEVDKWTWPLVGVLVCWAERGVKRESCWAVRKRRKRRG